VSRSSVRSICPDRYFAGLAAGRSVMLGLQHVAPHKWLSVWKRTHVKRNVAQVGAGQASYLGQPRSVIRVCSA